MRIKAIKLTLLLWHSFVLRCLNDSLAGLERTGIHRQRFIAESLRDLRKSLRAIGSDLLILEGRPEDAFAKLMPLGSIIVAQKVVLALSLTMK